MAYETLEDIENCMNSGWTDGLPVIPPYGSIVDEMLASMRWKADDVVGEFPEHNVVVRAGSSRPTARLVIQVASASALPSIPRRSGALITPSSESRKRLRPSRSCRPRDRTRATTTTEIRPRTSWTRSVTACATTVRPPGTTDLAGSSSCFRPITWRS